MTGASGAELRYQNYDTALADSAGTAYTFDPQGSAVQPLTLYLPGTFPTVKVRSSSAFDGFGLLQAAATADTSDAFDPFGFGGQAGYYRDYSGLSLLTHRYYDAGAGRFVTRDPIGYKGGLNLYGFAGNNPVNRMDPLGLDDDRIDQIFDNVLTTTGGAIGIIGGGTFGAGGGTFVCPGVGTVGGAIVCGAAGGTAGALTGHLLARSIINLRHILQASGPSGGGGIETGPENKPVQHDDEISTTSLRGKSLTSGEKALRKLGLRKMTSDRGTGFKFVDKDNITRVRWDRGTRKWPDNHWHKFGPNGEDKLTDSGHIVDDSKATKVHIPSAGTR